MVAYLSLNVSLYRPEYGYLSELGSLFSNIPLMALTATATPYIRDQLIDILRNPIKEISSVNRPNIALYAYELTKLARNG